MDNTNQSNWFAISKAIWAIKSCWSLEQLNVACKYCDLVLKECVSDASARSIRDIFRLCMSKQKYYLKRGLHVTH